MTLVSKAPLQRYSQQLPRRLPRLLAGIADGWPVGLNEHESRYGRLPLPAFTGHGAHAAAQRAADRLIDVIERSGLTGRGGAGFPTARKLRSVAEGTTQPVVVANGCEGEPASRKDLLLLSRMPHLVLDGISLAAFAVGAGEAYLTVHGANERLLAALEAAAQARSVAGIDPVPVQVLDVDDRYVASEQTAIVQAVNGGAGRPAFAPPSTHQRGVANRPTAVNNVETLAHLALIARYGDSWFRQAGARSAPGTALVTISGAVAKPGVLEIELGTPIGEIVLQAGGPTERPQAILVGGYFGTWLPVETAWRTPMSHPGLRAAGGAMGAGVLVVLPDSSCGLAETARVVHYLAQQSARQCGPCQIGLPALAGALAELSYHGGHGGGPGRIAALIPLIAGRGTCRHPDRVTALTASALATFRDDIAWHEQHGPCWAVRNPPLLPVPGDVEYW